MQIFLLTFFSFYNRNIDTEALPKENDPFNKCKRNYFLSTYKRLGSNELKPIISTTQEMFMQVHNSKSITPKLENLYVLSFINFHELIKLILRAIWGGGIGD